MDLSNNLIKHENMTEQSIKCTWADAGKDPMELRLFSTAMDDALADPWWVPGKLQGALTDKIWVSPRLDKAIEAPTIKGALGDIERTTKSLVITATAQAR